MWSAVAITTASGSLRVLWRARSAAAVIATAIAAARLGVDVGVTATVPMAENMPSSTAQRPGDVLTQYGGKTIEVLNTDAEGRLILCDALTYAERFKPAAVVDIATLTGAALRTLGTEIAAAAAALAQHAPDVARRTPELLLVRAQRPVEPRLVVVGWLVEVRLVVHVAAPRRVLRAELEVRGRVQHVRVPQLVHQLRRRHLERQPPDALQVEAHQRRVLPRRSAGVLRAA